MPDSNREGKPRSDDVELPRRGYDTKDVEQLTRESRTSQTGMGTWIVALVVVAVAIAVVWMLLRR